MNQEYVLLGGLLWKLLGKKIFFWRNHPHGDFGTQVAAAFSDKVFCTSKHSFTARFSKTEIMPAGIDTELFTHHTSHITHRVKNSLLMFGRVAPVKRIEIALETLALLKQKGIECTLSIVGDVLAKNQSYFQILKDRAEMLGIDSLVRFDTGVPFAQAPHIYSQHEIFLNFTPSGSFDKTVIEALACGTKVLVSNESMKKILPTGSFTTEHVEHVANNVERLMMLTEQELIQYNTEASDVVRAQSLSLLMEKLVDSFATK
jgi:glycosyltransferase involved in cell wall biosynthesis